MKQVQYLTFNLGTHKFPIHYGLFFATLKMRPWKIFLGPKLFLKIKIFNFYLQNNFGPIGFLLARLFFRRKKTVRSESEIC